MFSKSKINEPGPKAITPRRRPRPPRPQTRRKARAISRPATPKAKPPASLSADLHLTGNVKTTGDIQVEGTVEGDIRAHLLTIGESATIKGEVTADDVVINGRIVGRVRGLKVRLTATARVEGDIIHKTIAIESGAHFEGSVQRQDDPLNPGLTTGGARVAGAARFRFRPLQRCEPAFGSGRRDPDLVDGVHRRYCCRHHHTGCPLIAGPDTVAGTMGARHLHADAVRTDDGRRQTGRPIRSGPGLRCRDRTVCCCLGAV
jgi:cytoskeletal protein CcmA (bactofilin family)